jgi:hypothetical protein
MHFYNSSYAPRSQLHLPHCVLTLASRDQAHSKNGIPWVEATNVQKMQIMK